METGFTAFSSLETLWKLQISSSEAGFGSWYLLHQNGTVHPLTINSAKNSSQKASFWVILFHQREEKYIFNPEQNLFKVYVLNKPFTENCKYNVVMQ